MPARSFRAPRKPSASGTRALVHDQLGAPPPQDSCRPERHDSGVGGAMVQDVVTGAGTRCHASTAASRQRRCVGTTGNPKPITPRLDFPSDCTTSAAAPSSAKGRVSLTERAAGWGGQVGEVGGLVGEAAQIGCLPVSEARGRPSRLPPGGRSRSGQSPKRRAARGPAAATSRRPRPTPAPAGDWGCRRPGPGRCAGRRL